MRPQDVLVIVNEAISRNRDSHPNIKKRVLDVVKPLMERLERFGSATDILAQCMPGVMGLNLVGLVWGFLKFVIVVSQWSSIGFYQTARGSLNEVQISREITDTVDAVFDLLDRIQTGLPAWETYATIFGSSDIQLLRTPLVNIYAQLIAIGVHAVKFFNTSKLRKRFTFSGDADMKIV